MSPELSLQLPWSIVLFWKLINHQRKLLLNWHPGCYWRKNVFPSGERHISPSNVADLPLDARLRPCMARFETLQHPFLVPADFWRLGRCLSKWGRKSGYSLLFAACNFSESRWATVKSHLPTITTCDIFDANETDACGHYRVLPPMFHYDGATRKSRGQLVTLR